MVNERKLPRSLEDLVYIGDVLVVTEYARAAGIECEKAVITREMVDRGIEWMMPEAERGCFRAWRDRLVTLLRRVAVAQSVRWPTLTVVNQRRGALGKVGGDVAVYRTGIDPREPKTIVIAFRDELGWLNAQMQSAGTAH